MKGAESKKLLQASRSEFVLPKGRAQRVKSFSRPLEGNLFYLYEGPREHKASPGHWKGICFSYMKGAESKKLLQASRANLWYLYEGPREQKLLQANSREFVLPI